MSLENTDEIVYSFFKFESTDEIHIFEGEFTQSKKCNASRVSVCEKVSRNQSFEQMHRGVCLDEDKARNFAVKIGRPVCGTCVSHLYESYEKDSK